MKLTPRRQGDLGEFSAIEWFGSHEDQELARIAYLIAFPLILVCTVCLIVDLERPERFWHMMLKSEVTKEAFAQGFPFSREGWALAVHTPLWVIRIGNRCCRIDDPRHLGFVSRHVHNNTARALGRR